MTYMRWTEEEEIEASRLHKLISWFRERDPVLSEKYHDKLKKMYDLHHERVELEELKEIMRE